MESEATLLDHDNLLDENAEQQQQERPPGAAEEFPKPSRGRSEDVPFATFCDLLEALTLEHRHARRVEILRDFREKYLTVRLLKLFFIYLLSFSLSLFFSFPFHPLLLLLLLRSFFRTHLTGTEEVSRLSSAEAAQ